MYGAVTRRLLVVIGLVLLSLGVAPPIAAAPTPCADLVTSAFSISPTTPIAGQPATITITVLNQGTCSTNVSFVVQWKQTQFSPTGPSASVGPLAAGASATVNLTYTFPAAGNFLTVVNLDTNNAVAETNEVNNLAIYSVSVQKATIDLQITNFFISPNASGQSLNTAGQGLVATAYIQIFNNGNTAAGPFEVAWRPTTAIPPLTTAVAGLGAGASQWVTFDFNYPTLGTFVSQATVDATHLVAETNEFNNNAFTSVTVLPALPDLVVSSVTFSPSTPIAGQNVHVTVTVQNVGFVSTGANYTVQWQPGPFLLPLSQQVGPLAAGASASYGFDYIYQSAGTFNSTATADSNNVIKELKENNNSMAASVVVQAAGVDLTITNVVISPATPVQGAPMTATVTIQNLGNQGAGPFVVSWNPDANGLIVPGVATLTQQVNALGAGASMNVVFTFTYPQAGGFHTIAMVDAFNTVAETNETNNLYIKDFTVVPGNIDLTVTGFSISPSPAKQFQQVTATITVENDGALPVSWFAVQWKQASTDLSGPTTWIPGLNPGESKTVTFTGLYFQTGVYTSVAIVDPSNLIPETNESNNTMTFSITINPFK